MADGVQEWRIPEEGLWGFSHCGTDDTWYPWSGLDATGRLERLVGDLAASGANSFRPQLHRHRVEPPGWRGPSRPEEVTGDDVSAYGDAADWGSYDSLVDSLAATGLVPHLVLGAAYDFQLPRVLLDGKMVRATPDIVGRDRYLASLLVHARAAARHYRGRVRIWQLENELNAAGETMLLVRWRSGRCWLDSGFLTAVMEVLHRAVRMEDPGALTSHNFHCQWRIIRGVYDWRRDVKRWSRFLDVVGVDSFPNYLWGWPQLGRRVGAKVAQAVGIARGRPVMVLESGYPVRPRRRGMSESGQADFVREALEATVDAGGSGFYYYTLVSPEGFEVEGPWSNRFVQSVEPWWGMVRRDDTKRPSWDVYRDALLDIRERGRLR
ncbi:MAG: hypothetical protein KKF41_03140 [Actinobacteria bacterium]|nr:hypothetical protein [Actinomycetota bacterium]MBU1943318.1 hypothetical protein [Actinomycetota bacterium]MBU2686564.1 hypothetical protein [Actinomycetota bacterium]